ncbi:MAG TPA: hypothetical protein VKA70_18780 [Blastocatellia bacterium]|nr:hypothetical protein [Blastocatellia bacterium]
MTDRQYLDHILRVEERLMDEYVRGEIDLDERGPFETHFLNPPERRDKLEFAESLNRHIAEAGAWKEAAGRADARSWLGRIPIRPAIALLTAATLVLAACTTMLLIQNARLKKQVLEQQANLNQAEEGLRRQLDEQMGRSEELARQLEQSQKEMSGIKQELSSLKQENGSRRESPAPVIASLVIAPGSVRDGGRINRADLTARIEQLRLELKLREEDYRSYRIEVKTVEGKSIWKEVNLRARRGAGEKSVVATLPAAQLREGDYLATLSGLAPGGGYEEVATYYFTILRD